MARAEKDGSFMKRHDDGYSWRKLRGIENMFSAASLGDFRYHGLSMLEQETIMKSGRCLSGVSRAANEDAHHAHIFSLLVELSCNPTEGAWQGLSKTPAENGHPAPQQPRSRDPKFFFTEQFTSVRHSAKISLLRSADMPRHPCFLRQNRSHKSVQTTIEFLDPSLPGKSVAKLKKKHRLES